MSNASKVEHLEISLGKQHFRILLDGETRRTSAKLFRIMAVLLETKIQDRPKGQVPRSKRARVR